MFPSNSCPWNVACTLLFTKLSAVVRLPLLTISETTLMLVVIEVLELAPTPYAKSNAFVTAVRTLGLNFHKRSGAVHCSEVFEIDVLEAVSIATMFLAIDTFIVSNVGSNPSIYLTSILSPLPGKPTALLTPASSVNDINALPTSTR